MPNRCGESLERRPDAKPAGDLAGRRFRTAGRVCQYGTSAQLRATEAQRQVFTVVDNRSFCRATAKGAGGACRLAMTRVLESVRILLYRRAT